jgi:hypothetical protein
VFEALPMKGLTSWNCMIGGFAVHSRGENAGRLFDWLQNEGVSLYDITQVNVHTACAHAGMASEAPPLLQLRCSEIRRRAQDGALLGVFQQTV